MRRWSLLLAGGLLWLFLAAIPALADGGPHVANTNNGSLTLTADSCAGCHRAHTAQGQYLITASSETLLCLSCHGATSTGATVDVTTGVQYRPSATYTRPDPATQLGATRAGGFLQARLGDPLRLATSSGGGLRAKVTVGAAEPVTSAHLHVPGSTLISEGIAWGNGLNGSGVGPEVELECTSCHNPHGNGQYRILNTLPSVVPDSGVFTDPTPITVALTNGDSGQDYVETAVGHQFMAGDLVTLAGLAGAGLADGDYVVVNVPNGIRIKVAAASAWPTTTAIDITSVTGPGSGTPFVAATVRRTKAPVGDSPLGTPNANGAYPTKNYTVMQKVGTQGDSSTFLFYAQDVIGAGYPATAGDYFHRQVPWNPSAAATTTMEDAPNGKPATKATAGPGAGDVAFGVQMTAWCATCHTRYFGYQNPNPTGTAPGTSAGAVRTVTSSVAATGIITTSVDHGFVVGDGVEFVGVTNLAAETIYKVATVPSTTTFTITGAAVGDGTYAVGPPPVATAQRTAPVTASAYFFPRVGDSLFKIQHSTRSNRVCTTCHVAHGSNTVMDGTYSAAVPLPNGAATTSSRLLKVGNRGLCTLCHDPSSTVLAGTFTSISVPVNIASSDAASDALTTAVSHGLIIGDSVVIKGHDALPSTTGSFYVKTVPTGTTFTVSATPGGPTFDIAVGGTGVGTVTRVGSGPLPVLSTNATFDTFTTTIPHGLLNGDYVYVVMPTGLPAPAPATNGSYYVVGATATTFQISLTAGGPAVVDITVGGPGTGGSGGSVTRIGVLPLIP